MYIKYQKIVRNESGIITSGSASLMRVTYCANAKGDRTKSHSSQEVVERLGKVIWIDENDKRQGIFNSPTRGLVHCNAHTAAFTPVDADDPRLEGTSHSYQSPRIHTNFGTTYLFFSEMEKTPFMRILRSAFTDQHLYKKALAHLTHDCLGNQSSIQCGDFFVRNSLSHLLEGVPVSTLNGDTSYYSALSDDNLKVRYFKAVVVEMRKICPEFGVCCYVDSTPLPEEAENNPFNALSSHGTDGATTQSRLVLILDIQTNIPVWFEIISANILDKSTIMSLVTDVETSLGINIDMFDLDAGYAREELFDLFNRTNSTYTDDEGVIHDHALLVRMPAINGYERDDLYIRSKPIFYDPDYEFDYEHHTFFGIRYEVDLFDHPEYAFVFIDKTRAEDLLRGWRTDHWDEWIQMSKSAKEWYQVKDGFFVLIGNKDQTLMQALVEYRGRTSIETFIKDGKSYLRILPLNKWNKETITGKILHDIIETTFYREFRKRVAPVGMSMSNLIVTMNGWECVKTFEDMLQIKTPNVDIREILEKLGYGTPGYINLTDFRKEILEGIPMTRIEVEKKKPRTKKQEDKPISPEEKLVAKEKEKMERERRKAEEKARRS